MPILNKRERVEAIMRYIQAHRFQQNTADTLGRELDIPIATIRKTLNVDYPQCFDRDPDDRRNITLTMAWPDNRPFDLEPIKNRGTTEPLKAQHLHNIDTRRYLTTETHTLLGQWARTGIAGNFKPPDEYWTLYNSLQVMLLMLKLLRATNPTRKVRELVDSPEDLPGPTQATIELMERTANKT